MTDSPASSSSSLVPERMAEYFALVEFGPPGSIETFVRKLLTEVEGLQREKAEDAWHRGWQVAVAERDEARRQLDAVKAKLEAAEARAEAAESQLAIAEEGRLSALRHCARLEDALASPVRDAGEGEQAEPERT